MALMHCVVWMFESKFLTLKNSLGKVLTWGPAASSHACVYVCMCGCVHMCTLAFTCTGVHCGGKRGRCAWCLRWWVAGRQRWGSPPKPKHPIIVPRTTQFTGIFHKWKSGWPNFWGNLKIINWNTWVRILALIQLHDRKQHLSLSIFQLSYMYSSDLKTKNNCKTWSHRTVGKYS